MITDRLVLEPLSENEAHFILELLNTEGWIKYIGNRNIGSEMDARAYIDPINNTAGIDYWVAKQKADRNPIGLVTLMQRDYLEFKDIGFAFLPDFTGKGYAYEATREVLMDLMANGRINVILAITQRENVASVRLIKRLGLKFERTVSWDDRELDVYRASKKMLRIALCANG